MENSGKVMENVTADLENFSMNPGLRNGWIGWIPAVTWWHW